MRHLELKQGDLENLIANALWTLEAETEHAAVHVGDIQAHINQGERQWAYTTVKTVVDRLVDKGLASRVKVGKKFAYVSVLNRENAGLAALKKLTRQFFRNDLDELQVAVSQLRQEGFAIQAATRASQEELERAFNTPAFVNLLASVEIY
jgi:predicted transcriptional regulator